MIAGLARRAHGLVTHAQLLAAGVSAREIRRRVESGALIPVHRGVYRVGHEAPSLHATYMAAVLACGDGALLRDRAAAHLMGLTRGWSAPRPQVLTRTERRVEGIETRRARRSDVRGWRFEGIPCTTVPQTLVDLAAHLPLDALARACHEAGVRYRTTPRQVRRVLRPNARGAAKLAAVLDGTIPVSLSALEAKFRERLLAAGLPLPDESNRVASAHRVDCRYRHPPLTIELDSYTFHNSRHAWENDRHREREAYARGDEIRRFTYGDVFEDPAPMLAELRDLLAR